MATGTAETMILVNASGVRVDVFDLANSNGLAVAIIDANGDQITSFGGGSQYTEDAAAAGNPVGTMLMAVRADTPAAVTDTDGDNIAARATNKGEIYVKHIDSIPVTNGGTFVVQENGPALTALQLLDDTVATIGAATPAKGILMTAHDGTNAQAVKVDTNGELQVDILTLPALPAGTNNIGDVDVLTLPALTTGNNVIGQVKISDGTDVADVLDLPNSNPLVTALVDGNGDQITSFGGGVEYTEGDIDASITGKAVMMEVAANTLQPIQGTVADGLLVNLGANNDVTVTGSVTANAGTNLNTSSLALEATLQSVKTAVETIDNAIAGSEMQVDIVTMPAVTISGAIDTELPAAAVLADNTANPTVPGIGTFPHVYDGLTWDRMSGNITDGLLVNLGANNDVTITSSALPTGAATSANQTTIIGHLDGVEGLLTTIDADTSNISTKIDTLAGAVAGTEMQVDVLTMPTVTVQATNLDIRDLTFAADKVDASGSSVSISSLPNEGQQTMANSISVAIASDQGPISVTGTVSVNEPVSVDDNGGSLTVDAPVGTPVNVQIGDGTLTATVRNTGTSDSLNVAIVDAAGNQVTSFGGGVQYTEGDTDASITGTAMLMEVAADTLQPVQGTVADGLLVNLGANNDVTVTGTVTANLAAGTNNIGDVDILSIAAGDNNIGNVDIVTMPAITGAVTANAGTNLNTSLLSLESTQADIRTSVQLIDDVVFTDDTSTHATGSTKGIGVMAVANPTDAAIDANDIGMLAMTLARALKTDITTIAGTAVDTNSGNKSAGTQRVILATDQVQLTTPLNVTIQSGATGGDTVYHLVTAATTNATNIKASAGKVTGWYIYNSNAAARKVAFHNSASTPTAGSSVYFSLVIPPLSGANVSFPDGLDFSTGIGITTVTGLADSDSAAVAANDLIINIFYK